MDELEQAEEVGDAFESGEVLEGREAEAAGLQSQIEDQDEFTADPEAEPSQEAGFQVQTGDVSGPATVIGQQTINNQFGSRVAPQISPLGMHELELRREVFERPCDFNQAARRIDPSKPPRIVVVYGPENAGKLTFAVNWATDHCGVPGREGRIDLYRRDDEDEPPLPAIVESSKWAADSVVILEDAFDHAVSVGDFGTVESEQLTGLLETKRSFLILTTELPAGDILGVGAEKVDASEGIDLRKILERHLAFYSQEANGGLSSKVVAAATLAWDDLKDFLRKPYLIDRFCRALVRARSEDVQPLKVAQETCPINLAGLRFWFEALSTNEKLFALLAYLFEGVERRALFRIYQQGIETLRAGGFPWARDARAVGLLDIAEKVQLQPESMMVKFEDALVRQELKRQCANRQLLLWCVLAPRAEEVACTGKLVEDDKLRGLLGVAVGRLGASDRQQWTKALSSWARARSKLGGTIASLPGYALAQLLVEEPRTGWTSVRSTLQEWINSTEPDLVWAAGAALWRVFREVGKLSKHDRELGQEIRQDLLRKLRRLVERTLTQDLAKSIEKEILRRKTDTTPEAILEVIRKTKPHQLRDCAAYALERMRQEDSAAVVELLCAWLAKRKDSPFREVALDALKRSFDNLPKESLQPRFSVHAPLLRLLRPALSTTGSTKSAIATMMTALRAWLKGPDWHDPIFAELLAVANLADAKTRENLCAALARFWLPGGDNDAVSMAQAVISRCQVMDGVVIDQPDFGSAVLAVDPSFFLEDLPAKAQDREALLSARRGAAWHLASLLESQLDLTAVRLGHRGAQPLRQRPESVELESPSENHRLLLPGLEAVERKGVRLIVVLTTGEVADIDDASDGSWTRNVLVIAAGRDVPSGEGVEVLRVGRNLEAAELHKVEEWLEARWANALVGAPPEAWWSVLRSFGYEPVEPGALEERLADEVDRLHETGTATGREDRARGALAAILWFAAADLARAIDLLKRWLSLTPEGVAESKLRRAMAAAGARALFSIHGAVVPLPRAVVAEQLFLALAAPLAKWHRDGAEAVLAAVERWLEDPAIVAFLAGDIQDGRGRLLRWAEAHVPERTEVLRATLARLEKAAAGEELGFAGTALGAALDRLSYTMEVGPALELPELGPGERYGLIVIDPKANDDPLAQLAINLAQELAKAGGCGIKPALFRLGERAPAWVPSADPSARVTVGFGATRLPQVLGAVLAEALLPTQVAFVLALTETPILDEEDWIGTTWYSRLYTYRPSGLIAHERPWLTVPPFAADREAQDLAAYLAERTGFRWAEQTMPEPPVALPSGPDLTVN